MAGGVAFALVSGKGTGGLDAGLVLVLFAALAAAQAGPGLIRALGAAPTAFFAVPAVLALTGGLYGGMVRLAEAALAPVPGLVAPQPLSIVHLLVAAVFVVAWAAVLAGAHRKAGALYARLLTARPRPRPRPSPSIGGPIMPDKTRLLARIENAASVVTPYWPLDRFIAANPLQGLEGLPFEAAVAKGAALFGGRGWPMRGMVARAYAEGRIDPDVLAEVAAAHGRADAPQPPVAEPAPEAAAEAPPPSPADRGADQVACRLRGRGSGRLADARPAPGLLPGLEAARPVRSRHPGSRWRSPPCRTTPSTPFWACCRRSPTRRVRAC